MRVGDLAVRALASCQAELKADRRGLKLTKYEMELAHEEYLKSLKREQDQNITRLRQEFEGRTRELHYLDPSVLPTEGAFALFGWLRQGDYQTEGAGW